MPAALRVVDFGRGFVRQSGRRRKEPITPSQHVFTVHGNVTGKPVCHIFTFSARFYNI